MVEYLSLKRITGLHADEIRQAVNQVIDSGWYLQGEANARFESQYASYVGTRCCVGCANGLDALTLILRAYIELGVLQQGDEVIVPANTYIATILSITENHLIPILVEPRRDTLQIDDRLIEQAITPRTKALMLVHLYGRCAWTPGIAAICKRHGLKLIEDNAQAHGCMVDVQEGGMSGRKTGSLGDAAAHSFYPGKNLGALGDGGAVTTDDMELAHVVRALANYGSSRKYVFPYRGRNSRLDEIQAAVVNAKLPYLDAENKRRREIAQMYHLHLHHPDIEIPGRPIELSELSEPCLQHVVDDVSCVFHIYPILCRRRDALQQHLHEKGIGTMIHYPIPPHQQACYAAWNHYSLPVTELIHREELSLPCHPALTDEEVLEVCEAVNSFV